MQITTETFGNVLVAHTPDELTDDTASAFRDALEPSLATGQSKLVLQMDCSDTYDSAGLTMLVDLQDELRERGGNIKICGLTDPGLKILEVTRLSRRFDLFDSVIEAVASFQ